MGREALLVQLATQCLQSVQPLWGLPQSTLELHVALTTAFTEHQILGIYIPVSFPDSKIIIL